MATRARLLFIVSVSSALVAARAQAQNTSNMAGPEVVAGERSVEYRVAYSAGDDGGPGDFAHRLHYQQSLGESWRLRLVASAVDRGGDSFDLQAIQIHAFWQFLESERRGWDSALVSQLAVPTSDGRPGRIRIGWSSSIDLTPRWQTGGVIFTGREFGEEARDGLLLEVRGEATYKLSDGLRVGAQMFSDLNTTADFASFDEQRHQLGFIVKGTLTKRLRYNAGALFGLSAAASDVDLRLFLSRAL